MGPTVLNTKLAYASWLGPPILVRQARKPVFDSPTPLFAYGKLSIKKTWVTLCWLSWNQIYSEIREAKWLMELKVHHDAFKPTNSLEW